MKIKFRAWEKKMKEIIPVYNIDFQGKIINIGYPWRNFDEVILMQFTGKYDINKKEIYVGDIIKRKGFNKNLLVYIDNISCGYCCKSMGSIDMELGYAIQGDIEVIGNIYENPELLKE